MSTPAPGAVLFDLDGTLLDTADDFVVSVQQMCERYQIDCPEAERIRAHVSDGSRALVKLAFKLDDSDEDRTESLREEFLDIYEAYLGQASTLFQGISQTLNTLAERALPWGIVTNKPRRFAQPLMERMALQPEFGVLVCPDDVSATKPDPEPMYKAASALNCKPEQCIYVGDHERDIAAGRNAGMLTVAAAYGYIEHRDQALAWQADEIVDCASELPTIILNTFFK